jgi:hypothetical protein
VNPVRSRPRLATALAVAIIGALSFGLTGAGSADAGKPTPTPPPPDATSKPVASMTVHPPTGSDITVPVYSLQWGAGLGVSSPSGGTRATSNPSISELTVSRNTDSTSPVLFGYLTRATTLPVVTLTGALPDGTPFEYELRDVIISGFSSSAGGSSYQESLSLNFTKIIDTVGGNSTAYDLVTATGS